MSALFSVLPAANALIRRPMMDPGALTRIFREPNLLVVDGVWFDSETIAEEEEDGCSEGAKLEGRLVLLAGVEEEVEEEEDGAGADAFEGAGAGAGVGAAVRGVVSVTDGCGDTGADSAGSDSRSNEL